MTITARLTALLALFFITPLAQGQQGPLAGTAYSSAVSAHPTVTYAPSPQGTLILPPPPPQVSVPVQISPVQISPIQVSPVVTYRPLVPVVPLPAQYYLGQGLLGQPKLYVPNQPVRNFLRYLTP